MKPGDAIQAGDDRGSPAAALAYLVAGPLAWAGHLLLVYAPQAALCAFRLTGTAAVETSIVRVMVIGVTVLAASAMIAAIAAPRALARLLRATAFLEGGNGRFMIAVMRLLAVLSLAGVAWAGSAALVLPPCPVLR